MKKTTDFIEDFDYFNHEICEGVRNEKKAEITQKFEELIDYYADHYETRFSEDEKKEMLEKILKKSLEKIFLEFNDILLYN